MSYLALSESPMLTLVLNWLVFDDSLAGKEMMSRPLMWRCHASPRSTDSGESGCPRPSLC